jgi:hypothetical protein
MDASLVLLLLMGARRTVMAARGRSDDATCTPRTAHHKHDCCIAWRCVTKRLLSVCTSCLRLLYSNHRLAFRNQSDVYTYTARSSHSSRPRPRPLPLPRPPIDPGHLPPGGAGPAGGPICGRRSTAPPPPLPLPSPTSPPRSRVMGMCAPPDCPGGMRRWCASGGGGMNRSGCGMPRNGGGGPRMPHPGGGGPRNGGGGPRM